MFRCSGGGGDKVSWKVRECRQGSDVSFWLFEMEGQSRSSEGVTLDKL